MFSFAIFTVTPTVVRFATVTDLPNGGFIPGPTGSDPHFGDPAGTLSKLAIKFPAEETEVLVEYEEGGRK
jgi:hypothetical protein